MNSSTSRKAEERERQEEIRRQIEELKGKLRLEKELPGVIVEDECGDESAERRGGLKREVRDLCEDMDKKEKDKKGLVTMLAPDTPSPKKKKRKMQHDHEREINPNSSNLRRFEQKRGSMSTSTAATGTTATATSTFTKPTPSNVLSRLACITDANSRRAREAELEGDVKPGQGVVAERSHSFETATTKRRKEGVVGDDEEDAEKERAPKRDSHLALVEELEPGPYEFRPDGDDPEFEKLEPHSGIRLVSRTLPHSTLYSYLIGRYYLSPSRLYSTIRLSSSSSSQDRGEGYDVPVPGDWVTIAVVAERGPIRFTRAPVGLGKDDDEGKGKKKNGKKKGQGSTTSESGSLRGKKFVTLKLIDFGASSTRGDSVLNLLLFEADRYDSDGKTYRGGSGGAFERMMELGERDVVALLNPRVLKPYQPSSQQQQQQQQTNVLALSPTSASSILVLGRARDLGMCTVRKKDGKVCGSWCDLRVSGKGNAGAAATAVCEYHVLNAVKDRRAGRNEFAIGTSSLSTSAKYTHKHAYDPAKKWGLQPSTASGSGSNSEFGATYFFSGHVVTNNNNNTSETMGREGQARAKRVTEAREEEKRVLDALRKGKGKAAEEEQESESREGEQKGGGKAKAKAYSAEFIKALGFDPKGDDKSKKSKDVKDKLDALEATLIARKNSVKLGPRPGRRVRSAVVVPKVQTVDLDEL